VPCEWLESSEPSYILYTSATTASRRACSATPAATPALALDEVIYCGNKGETYFATSDIAGGGHSYIIYGPLIAAWPPSCTKARRSGRRRRLVEHRREVQGHDHVLGATAIAC